MSKMQNNSNLTQQDSVLDQSQTRDVQVARRRYLTPQELIDKLTIQNQKLETETTKLRKIIGDIKEKQEQEKKEREEALEKLRRRNRGEKVDEGPETAEKKMEKQLDQLHKQIMSKQKKIREISNKIENNETLERIVELENTIIANENKLVILEKEKTLLMKIKQKQEKEINVLQTDKQYFIKMNNFKEDISKYKTQLKSEKDGQNEDQRKMKAQQEELVLIFHQYRDVCQQVGISTSLNLTRAVQNDKLSHGLKDGSRSRKVSERKYKSKKDQKIYLMGPTEPNKENYKKLWEEIQELKVQKMQEEDEIKEQQAILKKEKRQILKQQKSVEQKIREKTMEHNIAQHSINDIKKLLRFKRLKPLRKDVDKRLQQNRKREEEKMKSYQMKMKKLEELKKIQPNSSYLKISQTPNPLKKRNMRKSQKRQRIDSARISRFFQKPLDKDRFKLATGQERYLSPGKEQY